MSLIVKAAALAREAHKGQFRKHGHSDRPYTTHLARTAGRAALMIGSCEADVVAMWIHDIDEDTDMTFSDIHRFLGSGDVVVLAVTLARYLTNPSKKFPELSRAERKAMDLEHIINIPNRAKRLKMIDRIDNLTEALDDNETPTEWLMGLYVPESRLLLDAALRGVDAELEAELDAILAKIEDKFA